MTSHRARCARSNPGPQEPTTDKKMLKNKNHMVKQNRLLRLKPAIHYSRTTAK